MQGHMLDATYCNTEQQVIGATTEELYRCNSVTLQAHGS